MERHVLADRLVNYADAVVAFSLVNGFAFLISLGEPDIRCSIANVSAVAFTMNLFFPLLSSYVVFWLRGYELRLRAEPAGGDDGPDEAKVDPLVSRFWRIAFAIRLILIWLFSGIVIVGIYGATLDERCLGIL